MKHLNAITEESSVSVSGIELKELKFKLDLDKTGQIEMYESIDLENGHSLNKLNLHWNAKSKSQKTKDEQKASLD